MPTRVPALRNATRIVVVEEGRTTGMGSHLEPMSADGHHAALYRQQGLNEATRQWEAAGT